MKRQSAISRRTFLAGTSAMGLAGLTRKLRASAFSPIQNVLICCNENRSFDHYYGYAPFAGGYGVPRDYSQPDGDGGFVTPHHLSLPNSQDPKHDWGSIHGEWDNGHMDGFFTTDGSIALGYYNQSDLPFYYS